MQPAVQVADLTKTFGSHKALDALSLTVGTGEMVGLIGSSGSGKSTLLRHLAGLVPGDQGESGKVEMAGSLVQRGGRLSRDIRRRRASIGFVFQQFNLVGRLPVLTNVLVGALGRTPSWRSLLGLFTRADRDLAMRALQRVGIAEKAHARASTLSGGQQQRAAIARALVQQASVILADEPIASLDPESSRRVMEILSEINRTDRITVLVSLHQVDIARHYCPRIVALRHGRIAFDGPAAELTDERLKDIYGSDVAAEFLAPAMGTPPRPARELAPGLLTMEAAAGA
jgi:phosphonate transport system ATP-binding protein